MDTHASCVKELYDNTLKMCREQFDTPHPKTLAIMTNVAESYSTDKDYDRALVVFITVLNARIRFIGEHDFLTLTSLRSTGLTLGLMRRCDISLEFMEKALVGIHRLLGPTHFETICTMSAMARVLAIKGNHADALVTYISILPILRKIRGYFDEFTIDVMKNVAHLFERMGQKGKARKMYAKVFEVTCKRFGVEHFKTKKARKKVRCC